MPLARFGTLGALTFAGAVHAQGVPRKLAAPTATYDAEFTGIDGIRELKDGRVVVLDAKDKAIHVIDLKNKTGKKIGREGDGPGEFRLLRQFFQGPGDTIGVSDMSRAGKLIVITPTGEMGGLMSMTDSSLSTRTFSPTASDAAGRFYNMATNNPFTDSASIVRWDRGRARWDTVAKLMTTPVSPLYKGPPEVRQMPGGGFVYSPPPMMPFATANTWTVAGDGRIAIVEAEPYRVTLVNAVGVRVKGPTIQFTPIPVTDAEKAMFKEMVTQPSPTVSGSRGADGTVTRSYGFRKPTYTEPQAWPPTMPAFGRDPAVFASDGMLWVKRNTKAGVPPLYDLIDRAAKVAYQLELPAKTKVVGFGVGSVYLARVDDDDLHYLQRYALPK